MEIKAGATLDWAIAEAIGLQPLVRINPGPPIHSVFITPREWDEIRGIDHPTCEGDVACIPFQPSVDLNAAFAAAEKVGLWGFRILEPGDARESSRVWYNEDWAEYDTSKAYSAAPTPALAICAALLRLKGYSDDG